MYSRGNRGGGGTEASLRAHLHSQDEAGTGRELTRHVTWYNICYTCEKVRRMNVVLHLVEILRVSVRQPSSCKSMSLDSCRTKNQDCSQDFAAAILVLCSRGPCLLMTQLEQPLLNCNSESLREPRNKIALRTSLEHSWFLAPAGPC